MPARFELFQDAADNHYFRLRDEDGRVLLTSVAWPSRRIAFGHAFSLRQRVGDDQYFRVAAHGTPHFLFVHAGLTIARSAAFANDAELVQGLRQLRELAPQAALEESSHGQ